MVLNDPTVVKKPCGMLATSRERNLWITHSLEHIGSYIDIRNREVKGDFSSQFDNMVSVSGVDIVFNKFQVVLGE